MKIRNFLTTTGLLCVMAGAAAAQQTLVYCSEGSPEGFDPALVERVVTLVDKAEYKRRQYPPGPKISRRNFGRDRRVPITNGWRESLDS